MCFAQASSLPNPEEKALVLGPGPFSLGQPCPYDHGMELTAAVLTVSDRVAAGQASDGSGPAVVAALRGAGFEVLVHAVVADEAEALRAELVRLCALAGLVVTTGGTGLSPRDRTPEATRAVADYDVPGIAEAMRAAGARSTPTAVLSRGIAVVRGQSLIVNLPGSPAGAVESLAAILPALPHALNQLAGEPGH